MRIVVTTSEEQRIVGRFLLWIDSSNNSSEGARNNAKKDHEGEWCLCNENGSSNCGKFIAVYYAGTWWLWLGLVHYSFSAWPGLNFRSYYMKLIFSATKNGLRVLHTWYWLPPPCNCVASKHIRLTVVYLLWYHFDFVISSYPQRWFSVTGWWHFLKNSPCPGHTSQWSFFLVVVM